MSSVPCSGMMRSTASPTATASVSIRMRCFRAICASSGAAAASFILGKGSRRSARAGGAWTVTSDKGERFSAPILVNAAGSWADEVAGLAGVAAARASAQAAHDHHLRCAAGTRTSMALPFAKTVGDELYFAPESGRLFASPMDEVPSEPCDAQPEELEVALAAYRMEERTTVKVERIHSRWAGLRTFTPDKHPAAGFAARRRGVLLAGGAGRLWPADLAGNGGNRRILDRGHRIGRSPDVGARNL